MNWNQGIQGLLGGLSQGLGSFQQNRVQQEELANKAKLVKIQEAEELRQSQSAEFQRQKAAYEALAGDQDIDPTNVSQYGNMPFIKSPIDPTKVRRPLSSAEATQAAQLKLTNLGITEKETSLAGLEALRGDPNVASMSMPDMLRKMFQLGATNQPSPLLSDISAEATAKAGPQLQMNSDDNAVQQSIAGANNAVQARGQDISSGTQRYVADKAYDRTVESAEIRNNGVDVDPIKFSKWMLEEQYSNPKFKQAFTAAKAAGMSAEFQRDAVGEYRRRFSTGLIQ